ncbi:diguanylate cyclase [Thiolapillus sp.]|uniref:sensor domain-containing diguanylate cyclase n=1 Tax=Thiolapillus sp. TaxID=2017437 RepID=UPI0025E10D2C|nr:diguanylate cyclase [Thiolapillus sp.]
MYSVLGVSSYFYSAYLLSFLFANLAYTGHAYQYLWPDHPEVQHWANPVLVIVFCLFGLAFATSFLDTRQRFPRLYKAIVAAGLLVSLLTVLSFILGAQGLAMKVAMAFLILFSLGMMVLGVLSWRAGIPSAKYFLAASITHTSAIVLSAIIVLTALDWGDFGIHIIEIAMLVDAVLLAFALADQFRILQNEKFLAEKLANIDHLTGIWNRRGFQQLVSPLWHTGLRNQHHMSVILMDLDQFKRVNDRHGHASGDQVLQQTASMLNSSARAGDVLARWGGEEFILFLPETGLSKATHIAERLRQSLIRMETGLTDLPLTASLGVAHVHARDIGMEELIRYADSYLYRAKEEGRNRVFFGEAGDTANTEAQMAT